MDRIRCAFVALPLLMTAPFAQANELPQLLERALTIGEAANDIRWGFTSSFNNNDAALTFRYEPNEARGDFDLLAPEALSSAGERIFNRLKEDEDPDADLTYEQARVVIGDQMPIVVEETDEYVIYEVAPNPWDDLDADEASVMQHMRAQMTVDKASALVTQIRIFNPEPFHAQVIARIDQFEQIMRFEPEPQTGLPLMVSLRQELRGRALFQSLHQVREETYTDFTPRTANNPNLACLDVACVQEFLSPE